MARSSTPVVELEPPTIEQRVDALEQRMQVVESERPGRKPRPMLAIRQRDVCALNPALNTHAKSMECPDSSIYRYQSGCHGAACRLKQHNAYERRKDKKVKAVAVVAPTKKATAKKTAPKVTKAPAKKAPVRKAPAKKVAAAAPTPIKRVRKVATKPVTKATRRPSKPVSKRPSAA